MRKQKPIKHVEVGAFEFDFYFKNDSLKCTYLEIKCGEVATIRIDGRTHAYGYLLAAAEQGLNDNLHGYAAIIYQTITGITKDQAFIDDVVAAITAYNERKMAQGAEEAAAVTEAEETANQALMEDVAAEAEMTEAEREESRQAFKEAITKVIEEKEDGI